MTLEHYIGDVTIAVEVNCVVILGKVCADHFALHVACLGGICANKGALLVAAYHFVCNFTVEEYDGNISGLSGIDCTLSSIGRRGLNDVDNQKIGAICDSCVDLIGLGGLVVTTVIVLESNAQCGQFFVHACTHARDVNIREIIVEYCGIYVGSGSGITLRCGFALGSGLGLGCNLSLGLSRCRATGYQCHHKNKGK